MKARPSTPGSSEKNDLEALTPYHFLFGNNCSPHLPYAEELCGHRKLFRQTQAYANRIRDRFRETKLANAKYPAKTEINSDCNP